MKPTGRRGYLPAVLIAFVLLAGACTQPQGAASGAAMREAPVGSYLARGKRMLVAGEPNLAMRAFLTSMSVDGISADAMTGAGIAAQRQGMLTSARRYFVQARELAPDSMVTNNNLGVVLYMLKEYYPARNSFRRAFALSDGTSETAERNLNRVEETIALIEEMPATNPAISHDVIRLGTSEFRLIETASPEAESTAE